VEDYPDDAFDAVLAVNLKGVLWAIQHVLPAMKRRGAGAILVTGSLASERGLPMNVGYVASKHAVLGLSRAVASEAAAFGVRCNCIIPGLIETPMLEGLPPEAASQMARRCRRGAPARRRNWPRWPRSCCRTRPATSRRRPGRWMAGCWERCASERAHGRSLWP
jgi:NAD(P)-dependent dehydrogenase (short-subunit alcohol dehydrogenase family)